MNGDCCYSSGITDEWWFWVIWVTIFLFIVCLSLCSYQKRKWAQIQQRISFQQPNIVTISTSDNANNVNDPNLNTYSYVSYPSGSSVFEAQPPNYDSVIKK